MTFDELIEALRNLAEENRASSRPIGFEDDSSLFSIPSGVPVLQTWTLQPDHIEVLVKGVGRLFRAAEAAQHFQITGTHSFTITDAGGRQTGYSLLSGDGLPPHLITTPKGTRK